MKTITRPLMLSIDQAVQNMLLSDPEIAKSKVKPLPLSIRYEKGSGGCWMCDVTVTASVPLSDDFAIMSKQLDHMVSIYDTILESGIIETGKITSMPLMRGERRSQIYTNTHNGTLCQDLVYGLVFAFKGGF